MLQLLGHMEPMADKFTGAPMLQRDEEVCYHDSLVRAADCQHRFWPLAESWTLHNT